MFKKDKEHIERTRRIMKPENLELVKKTLKKAKVPFTPLNTYKKYKLRISYRTYLRGILLLMKNKEIVGKKVSHGRGKGINWIVTRNELVEREKKT